MTMIIGWVTMLTAALFDLRTKKIPLPMIGAAAGCSALAAVLCLQSATCTLQEIAASLLPGAVLIMIAWCSKEAVGFGDGLLLLATGPLFGWQKTMLCIPAALLLTVPVSVLVLVRKKADRKTKIPFVPFLAAGMGVISLAC